MLKRILSRLGSPYFLCILLFIGFSFYALDLGRDHTRWHSFSDPYDYIAQSRHSWTSIDLYAPVRDGDFDSRPFTVPVIYKLLKQNHDRIVDFQKIFHFLSALSFVLALFMIIRNRWLRYLLALFVFFIFSWYNFLGWTILLLSESISTSLFFIWLATGIYHFVKHRWDSFLIHLVITLLFSLTRDSWPYILVVAYGMLTSALFFSKTGQYKTWLVMLGVGLVLLGAQSRMADKGERYRLPVMNNIVYKIIPDEKATAWFISRGMPCAGLLKQEFGTPGFDVIKLFKAYNDPAFDELFRWIKAEGKSVYMKYLITHPAELLMLNSTPEERHKIFSYDMFYTHSDFQNKTINTWALPRFGWVAALFLAALSAAAGFWLKKPLLFFPLFMSLVFVANIFLLFSADALETGRHLYQTIILVQIVSVISILMILDCLILKGIRNEVIKFKVIKL